MLRQKIKPNMARPAGTGKAGKLDPVRVRRKRGYRMTRSADLRPWSSLTDDERSDLLAAYQPVLEAQPLTCSFDAKLARMQAWLAGRGVSITEAEIRGPSSKP